MTNTDPNVQREVAAELRSWAANTCNPGNRCVSIGREKFTRLADLLDPPPLTVGERAGAILQPDASCARRSQQAQFQGEIVVATDEIVVIRRDDPYCGNVHRIGDTAIQYMTIARDKVERV